LNLSKKLFYLIIFLLPLNLGKHFIFNSSYVGGLLVDYLIPTLYIQDILIIILVGTWLFEYLKNPKSESYLFKNSFFDKNLSVFYFFIFSLFLTVLISPYLNISFFAFLRTFLYFIFFLYTYLNFDFEKEFGFLIKILSSSFFLVSILGIAQFLKQSSVFNNYLFFGEQPYSLSVRGIRLENLLGFTVVPSYGLFRHPNVFGGLLSILLVWVFSKLQTSKIYYLYFITLIIALCCTFSLFSYASFVLGILTYLYLSSKTFVGVPLFVDLVKRKYLIFLLSCCFILSIIFPYIPLTGPLLDNLSFTRRSNLIVGSFELLLTNFSYGVGFNAFTVFIDPYIKNLNMGTIRFLQPVHNIFVLILTESGVVSFMFLLFIFTSTLFKVKNIVLFVSLSQLLFLSCFDHYFWTIHQSNLFFWLLLGLCWTTVYNYSYNK